MDNQEVLHSIIPTHILHKKYLTSCKNKNPTSPSFFVIVANSFPLCRDDVKHYFQGRHFVEEAELDRATYASNCTMIVLPRSYAPGIVRFTLPIVSLAHYQRMSNPATLRFGDNSTCASNFTTFVLPRRYAPGIVRPTNFSTLRF